MFNMQSINGVENPSFLYELLRKEQEQDHNECESVNIILKDPLQK